MIASPILLKIHPGAILRAIDARLRVTDAEREFSHYYVERTLKPTQITLIVAISLFALHCVLDWLLMPRGYAVNSIPFRVAAMILPLGFALATSYVTTARHILPYITSTVVALVGISTVIVGTMAARSGIPFVFWATVLVTISVYVVFGLRFHFGVVAGWTIFVAYVLLSTLTDGSPRQLVYGGLLLAFANLAGMYASLLLEQNARTIFSQENELQRLARTDRLTGISNRFTFDQHLNRVWLQARRDGCSVAVVIVDIDYFRLYNDCYGYQEGDRCIRAVADVLAASVKRPLDLVSRYAGAQFALVLYDPSLAFVETFADELCSRVSRLEIPHKGSDVAATITVSAGAALVRPRDGSSVEHILRSTEDALYEAKSLGRNRGIVYRAEWAESTSTRLPAIAL